MNSLVESNIPIPAPKVRTRATTPEYMAWRQLEVGQSVFLERKKLSSVMVYKSSIALKALRDAGVKWQIAVAEKDGVPGVRVWRTK